MRMQGHLQVYDLILKTRTPLFVGSGKKYVKKEYLYQPKTKQVSFLKEDAFFRLLTDRRLEKQFEQFIRGEGNDLYFFLTKDCLLRREEVDALTRYSVDASDALDDEGDLHEVHSFIRNAAGQIYLPGSTVKGAMRTVVLLKEILAEPPGTGNKIPEGRYLNRLRLRTRDGKMMDDAVNCILRGLQISDSLPVPDLAMMLAKKMDVSQSGNLHIIPFVRECIRPGTELHLVLTLDQSVLKGRITRESLLQNISAFANYYYANYVENFRPPVNSAYEEYRNCLILGGGAGFFSKTLAYPYWDDRALDRVSNTLDQFFPQHDHLEDKIISPRMLKYAQYRGELYPYGVCEVDIQ